MKYLRTKDGKLVDRLSAFNCFKSHGTTGRYIVRTLEDDNDLELWLQYNRTSVVKQSDNIEELVDCFVFVSPELTYPQLVIPMNFDYVKKEFEQVAIFGAIWVIDENGIPTLKPVAKMNDKGELRLL